MEKSNGSNKQKQRVENNKPYIMFDKYHNRGKNFIPIIIKFGLEVES